MTHKDSEMAFSIVINLLISDLKMPRVYINDSKIWISKCHLNLVMWKIDMAKLEYFEWLQL